MSCENEQKVIVSLLDGRGEFDGEGGALGHVEKCVSCNAEYRSLWSLRQALRTMHGPAMPDGLAARLRVLASHERERLLLRVNLAARLRNWRERLQLSFDNMMRPLALPFAGGLLSALSTLVIFASIMQTQAFPYNASGDVRPPMIATDPDGQVVNWVGQAPQLVPVTDDVSSDAIAVLLLIDPEGRVADYMVAQGEATREMKNLFLFSRFTPATSFCQPTWGYKLVLFPRKGAARS